MLQRKLFVIIAFLISLFTGLYFINQERVKKKNDNIIQTKIIKFSVEELIQKKDMETLAVLAKEGNAQAINYLKKVEERNKKEEAQRYFEMAQSYITSQTVDQDNIKTAKLYLSRASQYGHLQATQMLSNVYAIGLFENQNFDKAKELAKVLAETENLYQLDALISLSMFYFNIDKDFTTAKSYLKRALEIASPNEVNLILYQYRVLSNMGNKEATRLLQELNIPIKNVVEVDAIKIYDFKAWAEEQIKNNNSTAYLYLSTIAGLENKYDQSVEYARLAIKSGIDLNSQKDLLVRFRDYARLGNYQSTIFVKELSESITNQ